MKTKSFKFLIKVFTGDSWHFSRYHYFHYFQKTHQDERKSVNWKCFSFALNLYRKICCLSILRCLRMHLLRLFNIKVKRDSKEFIDISLLSGILYFEETTLHGFRYLTKPGVFSKLVWFITILVCFLAAVILGLYQNILDFHEERFIDEFWFITFPLNILAKTIDNDCGYHCTSFGCFLSCSYNMQCKPGNGLWDTDWEK